MTLHLAYPPLFGAEKNGKTKIWLAEVYQNADETAYSSIRFGQEDGKMQEARREYLIGKNLGKKNETTALQQCVAETERKWKDKVEKEGYTTNKTENDDEKNAEVRSTIYPMLAQTFDPTSAVRKKKTITFPCYVQPKIDGLRCIMYYSESDGRVVCQSRTGGLFVTVDHVAHELHAVLKRHPHWAIDGELYTRTYPFEELAGLIKKNKLSVEDVAKLGNIEYHIYDAVQLKNTDMTFSDRWKWIQVHVNTSRHIILVPTEVVQDLSSFRAAFSHYVAEGWEGIMLRNIDGMYAQNFRSHDLQKYKEFIEHEFPIVGWKEGEGRDKGTVIWVCKTAEGIDFSVRPRGTLEMRREWFENAHSLVGSSLTVIFQEWSEKKVPRFPVGKAIRFGY